MSGDQRPLLVVLLGSALLVTVAVHVSLVPRYVPNEPLSGGLALVAGWVSYTLVFYSIGRLRADPQELPTMRFADIGIALFLISLLLALALDAVGVPLESIVGPYVLPASGVYAGLALIGWSIGHRTAAINEIVR
ncbi:hypothetical protein [Natrinema ejinorense]|uniref:Uncharacterized protein n=1 Tax=Natrinema ejinorense TaxID=373386 RepID=A0A2A5QWS8_9EURY|nr:hypothetical protein [Natrinema ejinorense]PCR91302.1 hypothetical protein CP557_12655 [Natrinema ejinorense]